MNTKDNYLTRKKSDEMAQINETTGRCHNCGCYFDMRESPDSGATCSKKCSDKYIAYLNEGIRNL